METKKNNALEMLQKNYQKKTRGSVSGSSSPTQYTLSGMKEEEEKEKNRGGVLGGIGYVGSKVLSGITQSAEGVVDYLGSGIAKLYSSVTGSEKADSFAARLMENDWFDYNAADDWYNPGEGWKLAGDVASGIGQSAFGIGVGLLTGNPSLGLAAFGLSAGGMYTKEAYQETGEVGAKQFFYGTAMGGVELATELLTGSLVRTYNTIGRALGKTAAKNAAKQSARLTLKSAGKRVAKEFASEAVEEMIAEIASPIAKRLTYDKNAKNATIEEIAYAGIVGGLAGVFMTGAGGTFAHMKYNAEGNDLVKDGKETEIIDIAENMIATDSITGSRTAIKQLYEKLSPDVRSGKKLTANQRRALGELRAYETQEFMSPFANRSAMGILRNAETIATKLSQEGRYKISDRGLVYVQNSDSIADKTNVRDITADDIRNGYTGESTSVSDALKKNEVLRFLTASDLAGRSIMASKEQAKVDSLATSITSEEQLRQRTKTMSEKQKTAVASALGIANLDTVSFAEFNAKAKAYKDSGRMQQESEKLAMIEDMRNIYKARKMPKVISISDGAIARYSDQNANIAVARNGENYIIYDYDTGEVSRNLKRSEVNVALAKIRQRNSLETETMNTAQRNKVQAENDAKALSEYEKHLEKKKAKEKELSEKTIDLYESYLEISDESGTDSQEEKSNKKKKLKNGILSLFNDYVESEDLEGEKSTQEVIDRFANSVLGFVKDPNVRFSLSQKEIDSIRNLAEKYEEKAESLKQQSEDVKAEADERYSQMQYNAEKRRKKAIERARKRYNFKNYVADVVNGYYGNKASNSVSKYNKLEYKIQKSYNKEKENFPVPESSSKYLQALKNQGNERIAAENERVNNSYRLLDQKAGDIQFYKDLQYERYEQKEKNALDKEERAKARSERVMDRAYNRSDRLEKVAERMDKKADKFYKKADKEQAKADKEAERKEARREEKEERKEDRRAERAERKEKREERREERAERKEDRRAEREERREERAAKKEEIAVKKEEIAVKKEEISAKKEDAKLLLLEAKLQALKEKEKHREEKNAKKEMKRKRKSEEEKLREEILSAARADARVLLGISEETATPSASALKAIEDAAKEIARKKSNKRYSLSDVVDTFLGDNMEMLSTEEIDSLVKKDQEGINEPKVHISYEKVQEIAQEKISEFKDMSEGNRAKVIEVILDAMENGIPEKDAISYARVSARSGLDIVFDQLACIAGLDSNGDIVYSNGLFDFNQNAIIINPNKNNKSHAAILIHELSHALRAYKGDNDIVRYRDDKNAKISDEMWREVSEIYNNVYSSENRSDLIADEAIARYAEELLGTDEAINLLLGTKPTLRQKILSFFRKAKVDYASDSSLSAEAMNYLKKFKKMFDSFSEANKNIDSDALKKSGIVNSGNIRYSLSEPVTSYEKIQKEIETSGKSIVMDLSEQYKPSTKNKIDSVITALQIDFTNQQAGLEKELKRNGVKNAEEMVQSIRAASNAAGAMLGNAQYRIGAKSDADMVYQGKGLSKIFEQISKDKKKDFFVYLFHNHHIDRMSLEEKSVKLLSEKDQETYRTYKQKKERANDLIKQIRSKAAQMNGKSEAEIAKIGREISPLRSELAEIRKDLTAMQDDVKRFAIKQNKPVIGHMIDDDGKTVITTLEEDGAIPYTIEESKAIIKELEANNPEFESVAEEVWEYNKNLNQYRVDTGLISKEQFDLVQSMYPRYIPTFREGAKVGIAAISGARNVSVRGRMKKATGSTRALLRPDVIIARQTMETVRAGRINQLANALLDSSEKSPNITVVSKEKANFAETNEDPTTIRPKDNSITFYKNGEKYVIRVTSDIFAGFDEFNQKTALPSIVENVMTKVNNVFKSLITSYNPAFLIRNAARDLQDAGINTKETLGEFYISYAEAAAEIKRNGEYWKKYCALGGLSTSIFDYDKGYGNTKTKRGFDKGEGAIGTVLQTIENANATVEQLPRFAEFLASVKAGKTYEQAMYNSADVTTNFGRGGRAARKWNRTFIPFLNPAIQGAVTTTRTIQKAFESKDAKLLAEAIGKLLFRLALLGIIPIAINSLMYRDDEEYQSLRDADKENNFLIKLPNGRFIKIARGRLASVVSGLFNRVGETIKGNEDAFKGYGQNLLSQVTPFDAMTRNFFSAWGDVRSNTTWYGTDIEGAEMQNIPVHERYDESTSAIATAIAQAIPESWNVSPKKVHYLIDQYTGIIGDFLLPITTKKAERDFVSGNFTIDPALSNKLSSQFYSLYDNAKYTKNSYNSTEEEKDIANGTLKFLERVKDEVGNISKQKREIQASDLSRKEKISQTRVLQMSINALYKKAIADVDSFESIYASTINLGTDDIYSNYVASEISEETYDRLRFSETIRQMYGSASALSYYNNKVFEKASLLSEAGISVDTFYDYYFLKSGLTSDYDKDGEVISGSLRKKVEYIIENVSTSKNERRMLIAASGYSLSENERKQLKSYILNLDIPDDKKLALAEAFGFSVKDGKIQD